MKSVKCSICSFLGIVVYESEELEFKGDKILLNVNVNLENEFIFRINKKIYIWMHSYFVKEKEIFFKDGIDGVYRNNKYQDKTNIIFNFSPISV